MLHYTATLIATDGIRAVWQRAFPGVDGANYAILEIPTLDPPAPARFLVHECVLGPWAGSVHICQICNMTPSEIKRLPLLENLLIWDGACPQQWWEYEESTKPVFAWLRRREPGNSA